MTTTDSGVRLTLRPYQTEALDRTIAAMDRGVVRQLGVAATGLGKTVMFCALAERMDARTLILAHRDELIGQAAEKVREVWPSVEVGIVKAENDEVHGQVVVASVQTLARSARLARLVGSQASQLLGERPFRLVIVDEAHHTAADSYRRILEGLGVGAEGGPLCLGVTATPDRGDGKGLDDLFDEIVWNYDILWGIRSGYLSDVKGKRVGIEGFDLGGVRVTRGDFDQGQAGENLMDAHAPEQIVKSWRDLAPGRRTLVFTPTVAMAEAVADEFQLNGIAAGWVSGGTPMDERRETLRAFSAGRIDVLANCAVLTEGYDEPRVDCIVVARPTRSRALYCFDAETEVLTPLGWVRGNTITEGQSIAAFDPETSAVRWEPVLATVDRPLLPGERMMALRSPTIDVRVTDTHRMVWRRRQGRNRERGSWQVSTAGDLAQRRDVWELPVAGMEKAPGVALTDDEVRFVAWVQTDGCVNRANGAVAISQSEGPLADEIRRVLASCGMRWSESVRTESTALGPRRRPLVVFQISGGQWRRLAGWMPKADEGAWHRLEAMDEAQWAEFLAAWHDGDGSKQTGQSWTRRGYHLAIADEWVAGWVQAMCMRRGWRANVARQADLWMVHCRKSEARYVSGASTTGRPRLRPTPELPGERVWCVSVPSGAILTRRNGKGAVVGQTQMVGRGTRRHPDKDHLLVLDVVGATTEHSLVTIPSLFGIEKEAKEHEERTVTEMVDAVEREQVRMGRIVAADVEMFHQMRAQGLAWVKVHDPGSLGWYTIGLGGTDRARVTLRQSTVGEDMWSTFREAENENREVTRRALIVNVPLETAQGVGEDFVRKIGGGVVALTASDAPWRQRKPSDKQLWAAKKWKMPVDPSWNSGQLSEALDAHIAKAKARKRR